MSRKQGRYRPQNLLADVTGSHRPGRFHKNPATGSSKPTLPTAGFAAHQFKQIVVQDVVTKNHRKTRDSLLHSTDLSCDFDSLMHQLTQFRLRLQQNFLNMHVFNMRVLNVNPCFG